MDGSVRVFCSQMMWSRRGRLVGLGVWFSLRVREVPGSNPGRARFDYFPLPYSVLQFVFWYFVFGRIRLITLIRLIVCDLDGFAWFDLIWFDGVRAHSVEFQLIGFMVVTVWERLLPCCMQCACCLSSCVAAVVDVAVGADGLKREQVELSDGRQ